ncbi:hypothetical protein COB11_03120 [Candidatus Aerophobetes bacterium]|uniref:UVR domain-containing protein n=1 Tax=Aerophobetes bacterium TaxID=2030807 RepID=A0A2A4YK48_UNCAE|nr:MAG: hypothetical protein COB11_03120 [Candidatus Aerophobetes bacterium]
MKKEIMEDLSETFFGATDEERLGIEHKEIMLSKEQIKKNIKYYEDAMRNAAKEMRFEDAAKFRDHLRHYKDLEILEDRPL